MPAMRKLLLLACLLLAADGYRVQVRIDAAFYYEANGYLYLLSGDRVNAVRWGRERSVQSRSVTILFKQGEIDIQAAYTRFAKPRLVTYYGNTSGIFYDYRGPIKHKYFRYGRLRKFLLGGGPDAIGRRGRRVYCFKGCQMVRRIKWFHWTRPRHVSSLGLPCNVDAAWRHGSGMMILRGNQVWIWKEDNSVDGPFDFSSYYTLYSWELLPYVGP